MMQHADGRSDSDASAEKHCGLVAVAEDEVTMGDMREDGVTFVNGGMKMIGDETVLCCGNLRWR
jgi:hypothetical protein